MEKCTSVLRTCMTERQDTENICRSWECASASVCVLCAVQCLLVEKKSRYHAKADGYLFTLASVKLTLQLQYLFFETRNTFFSKVSTKHPCFSITISIRVKWIGSIVLYLLFQTISGKQQRSIVNRGCLRGIFSHASAGRIGKSITLGARMRPAR